VNTSQAEQTQNVRRLAAQVLLRVDARKAYADVLLDQTLKSATFDDRDRALLTEIIYGTLRWRGRLDACLKPWLRRPLQDTDPFIRNLLRLTVYQLVCLNRIPDYAAVNEAVDLAKAHSGESAAGFVNGVLRNILRGKKEFIKPDLRDSVKNFAEYWSHPEWLVEHWLKYFGTEELEALLKANNQDAPLVVRTNLSRGTREELLELFRNTGVRALILSSSPQGVLVQSRMTVEKLPGFHDGRFQVQGESSQLIAYLLGAQSGERILDACAAPGGKTTHIAELMGDSGQIIATDISPRGIKRIEENSRRLGLRSIQAFETDIAQGSSAPLGHWYDRILVDVPCSGFGTLRSHPEIKWNRNRSDVMRLSTLQTKLLVRAASYLKPGGILVYSTCTLTEDENENVVEDFLKDHNQFVLEDAAGYLPDQAKSWVRGRYFMALPHRHNADGFFAARMRKLSE
jgi:16S rRNA (cytosine967-C5)-methyltransferase